MNDCAIVIATMIVQCATFSKSLNPRNIDKTVSDIRIRFPFESSFWISVSGCKLTILLDANRIVIISDSQLLKPIFCPRTVVKLRLAKIIKLQNRRILLWCNIPFAVKLFLLPFSCHCSRQNIGFSDSVYVMKPLQPSSAVWWAPPVTGNLLL